MSNNPTLSQLDSATKRALLERASAKNPALKDRVLELSSAAEDARIALARVDPNVFVPYILTDEATGAAIQQAPAHTAYQNLVTTHKNVVIHGHVESGKAVPIDTPIPTPGGFVSMGDLQVGDCVFDRFGNRTRITFVSDVQYGRNVYRLHFSDGTSALADDDHQWAVWTVDDLRSNKDTRIVTTEDIRKKIKRGSNYFWHIPLCTTAVEYPHKHIIDDLYSIGYIYANQEDSCITDVLKITHADQRKQIIRGMMDACGSVVKHNNVVFTTKNKILAKDVAEIVASLGCPAQIRETACTTYVFWKSSFQCFEKSVEITKFKMFRRIPSECRKTIVKVEPAESVPVKCIGVDAPTHTYLMGRDYTVTHNSQQLSIGRVIFELGKNPNLRVVICKSTQEDAKKILSTIANHIMHNSRVRKVFPHLKPGGVWNTENITVERPNKSIKDPSVRVIGSHGAILGARIDLLIIDDLITLENSRTLHMRNDIYQWIKSVLMGRMTKNGKIVIVGNAWHPDDAMFRLARDGWAHFVYPVRDPLTKKPLWPERWPQERIDEAFSEKGLGPLEAARALDCQARSDEAARFKEEWIQACLERGRGKEFSEGIDVLPLGCFTFTGVDLGVGKELHHDWTVLTTIMAYPNGDFELLRIDAGKWTSPEIVSRIKNTHYAFKSVIYVESNAAQRYIVDFVKNEDTKIPVKSFTTRGTKVVNNKNHPQFGVEGIGVEMSNRRWIFPSNEKAEPNEQMKALIQGMLYYDPLGHTSDHLISLWIAREGARKRFSHRVGGIMDSEPASLTDTRDLYALPAPSTFREALKRDIDDIFSHIG